MRVEGRVPARNCAMQRWVLRRCSAKIPPIITTNLAIAIFIETLARYARLIARGKASWRACGPRKAPF